jgi:biotin carboxylase
MKTLLVIGGGIEAIPGVQLAKEMGLHVVVSDMNADAPCMALADDTLIASTYDIDSTVQQAREYHEQIRRLDGVMCIATDVPLTVATVAAELGLPGIPIEAARLASDKLLMKDKFAADGIPIPWYSAVSDPRHLAEIVTERGTDLVIKPADSRGSRGVLRLSDDVDLEWAFAEALQHSPSQRVMVEQFLAGPQVSTESLVVDGVTFTPGFADRNYELLDEYAPHIIEDGGELPSHLPHELQDEVRDLVSRAAASLGVTNGVVKGDIVISDGVPHVIELAARLSGGYFCTHEIPLNTGVDLVGNAIRLAVGDPVDTADLVPRYQRAVSQRYLFPGVGRVLSVGGDEDVATWPGVEMVEVRVQPGDTLRTIDSHPARGGLVLVTGDDRQEAMALAKRAIAAITIEMEPL